MKKSIKVDQKKRRGRPATGRGVMISSRIPALVVDAVDGWALQNETTRSDAVRRLVEVGLAVNPAARPKATSGAARAAELAANVIEKHIDPSVPAEERASRKRRLLKGPSVIRDVRVDRAKKK